MSTQSWILADLSTAGTVRFARADPGAGRFDDALTISPGTFITFSDALMAYARQAGIDLRTAGCVLSLPGPTVGNTIRVARSRWTLSRSGLGGMIGGPLLILNDMVATAWSLPNAPANTLQPLGSAPLPDMSRPGRWAIILLDDGVGAATLTLAPNGQISVADSEAGHIGFSPADDREFAIMRPLRGYRAAVSWEQMLTLTGAAVDPVQWAGLAGAFAGDVLLATAAWSGLILCGHRAPALRNADAYAAFVARGAAKSAHGRFIEQAAIGLLPAREPLNGCLGFLRACSLGDPNAPHPVSPA
ncbi:glucokinase [Sphingomonas nostoxanthinifaciens]|uniref:glucokinase n=1 Tax=Sphingomonas nostoxanthinifaciens TaxID=2872652 RepID=UPI001CC1D35C|nr:glucokinase [Sphingomonas nostoxanthinifaciens]UAK25997.1 glucokinase [Sphingomonas nostoxanthinifaciens]